MTETTASSIVVCGLPGSGKTTYLAALWHLVQSQEVETILCLDSLAFGDYEYVNGIRGTWQRGRNQTRTVGAAQQVGLDLKSRDGRSARLIFLDHSGETFDRLWETRSISKDVADQLAERNSAALFVRSTGLKTPVPLSDMLHIEKAMREAKSGPDDDDGAGMQREREWSADDSPDQVKIVDLLQTLAENLQVSQSERLAVIVSAWDRVDEYHTAEDFVRQRLPLLWQYLCVGHHPFEYRYYAVSAQGGDYVDEGHDGKLPAKLKTLLAIDQPSRRIRLLDDNDANCDLTLPLDWLISKES